MLSIQILSQNFEEAKLRNPHTSMRSYSQKLGISSGALSEIFSGKRNLSTKQKIKIIDKIQLSPEQKKIFLSEEISSHMKSEKKGVHHISEDQFHLISDWWHFAILNLINTNSFKAKLSWLSQRLALPREVVKDAYDRLKRLKYIQLNKNGRVQRKHPQLATTDDVMSLSIRKAHISDLKLIEKSILDLPTKARHTSSITFPVKYSNLAKARKLIEDFQNELLQVVASKTNGEEVYRLSVSLFPLTQIDKGKFDE